MADKITSFEDYVKKEVRHAHTDTDPTFIESEEDDIPVTQHTMEIEIEDPFQFLNADERDEYLRQRQKDLLKEQEKEIKPAPKRSDEPVQPRAGAEPVRHERVTADPVRQERATADSVRNERSTADSVRHERAAYDSVRHERPVAEPADHKRPLAEHEKSKRIHSRDEVRALEEEDFEDDYDDEEFEEEYGEDYEDERPEEKSYKEPKGLIPNVKKFIEKKRPEKTAAVEKPVAKGKKDHSDDDEDGGINMDLVVRVSSIITGIVILFFIAGLVKVKILDRIMTPDPDEIQMVVAAIPEGFTETNDMVVVTAESLNLRSVPSTESSETVVEQVPQGTEMKRIAISNDGTWALLERNSQQVYGYMKYLEVQ